MVIGEELRWSSRDGAECFELLNSVVTIWSTRMLVLLLGIREIAPCSQLAFPCTFGLRWTALRRRWKGCYQRETSIS